MLLLMIGASCAILMLSVFLCHRLLDNQPAQKVSVITAPAECARLLLTMRDDDDH